MGRYKHRIFYTGAEIVAGGECGASYGQQGVFFQFFQEHFHGEIFLSVEA
jgi:hypothetical protein